MVDIRSRLSLLSTTLRDEIGILRNGVLSLPHALDNLITHIASTFPITIESEIDEMPMDPLAGIEIFRIIRELLLNIAKHSQARLVTVTTTHSHLGIQVLISDDGVEFQQPAPDDHHLLRFGAIGVTERVASLGGTLTSQRDGSTNLITIYLPL